MHTPYGLKIATKTNNKFGAKKTEYDGIVYDSTAEAVFARNLDRLRLAHDPKEKVIAVERQCHFIFYISGKKIFTYILDFKVFYSDGSVKYFDVKGYKKGAAYQVFSIKKKCIEAQYNVSIVEV